MNLSSRQVLFSLSIIFVSLPVYSQGNNRSSTSNELLRDISDIIDRAVYEVVDNTVDRAKDVVRKKTGIDLSQRGYSSRREHRPLPDCSSDEGRRELAKLQEEYNREIRSIESELNRELSSAEDEFTREARKEDKAEKVYEKREKMQRKVDDAYARFDEKMQARDRKFDEKRDSIINKERGGGNCSN